MTGELSVLSIPGGTLGAEAFGSQGQRALLTIDAASVDVSTIKVLNIPGGNIASAPSSVGSSVYAIVTMTLTEAAGHEWREFWLGNIRLTRVQMTDTRYWALLIIDVADATVVNYRNYQVDGGVITTVYTGVARYHALLTLSKDSVTAANVRAFQLPIGVISRQEMTTQGFFAFLTSGGAAVVPPPTYLLRDSTTPDENAPLASPASVSPGPGEFVVQVDSGNKVKRVGGAVFIDQTTQITDPLVYYRATGGAAYARQNGLVIAVRLQAMQGRLYWETKAAAPFALSGGTGGVQLTTQLIGFLYSNVGASLPVTLLGLGMPVDVIYLALTTGGVILARLDGINFYAIYETAGGSGNFIDGYTPATVSAVTGQGYSRNRRNWLVRDTSLIPPTLAIASPSLNTDYVGEADGPNGVSYICPNPLTGNVGFYDWRKSGASDTHRIALNADGSIHCYKVVAGVDTDYSTPVNVAGAISAAQARTIKVVAHGNTFAFYNELDSNHTPVQLGAIITDSFNATATGYALSSTGNWNFSNLRSRVWQKAAYNTEFNDGTEGTLICTYGDSTSFGTGMTTPFSQSYPGQLRSAYSGKYDVYNPSVAGRTVDQMITAFPTEVAPMGTSFAKKIFVCLAGSNNINGADTDVQIYTKLLTLCGLARAAGWLVIFVPCTPRGDSSAPQEAKRVSFNSMAQAAGSAMWDRFTVVGSELSDPNNATYFQGDKVHYTLAGNAIMEANVAVDVVALAP